MDPRHNAEVTREFLDSVGHRQASKGYGLFANGAVTRITPDPEDWAYDAEVRDGGRVFDVLLHYHDDTGWEGECDCDEGYDCRHCAAVLHASRGLPAPVVAAARARPRSSAPIPPVIPKQQKTPVLVPSPLSQAMERQAIDRTHRIGQTNPVNAYRLIAKNSIEQKIRVLQKKKSAIAESVLGDERFGEALTLDDLKFILQD